MKARLTRKNIEEYVPKTLFKGKCENYQLLHVMSEIEELERLAEIGKATELAFKDGSKHTVFKHDIDYLLEFYKRECSDEE